MGETRSLSIRLTAMMLSLWGLVWIEALVLLHLLGRPLRGRCGSPPPWQTEHTLVVVVGALGLVLPWLLRRSGAAARTLTRGRPIGGIDAAIHAIPVIAAGTIVLLTTFAVLQTGGGCCSLYREEPLPWWAGWHYFAAFALAVVLARIGAAR